MMVELPTHIYAPLGLIELRTGFIDLFFIEENASENIDCEGQRFCLSVLNCFYLVITEMNVITCSNTSREHWVMHIRLDYIMGSCMGWFIYFEYEINGDRITIEHEVSCTIYIHVIDICFCVPHCEHYRVVWNPWYWNSRIYINPNVAIYVLWRCVS